MSSRWPLNILMWKDASKVDVNNPTSADFLEIHDDFEKARNLICDKLKNDGFAAGVMTADTRDEAYKAKHGFYGQPEHIELHYRAWDDSYRGRIVTGGLESKASMDQYERELREQYKKKVFTPNELYALTPINRNHDPEATTHYRGYMGHIEQWLKEENLCFHSFDTWDKIEEDDRVQLRILVN